MEIDQDLLNSLLEGAKSSDRKRMNYDLRTSCDDRSQRMLNALLPGTVVDIHRHPQSSENVLLVSGVMDEILFDDNGIETKRIHLNPKTGNFGCVVPKNVWHTVEVFEPSVIYEAKDGKYGKDGSETYDTARRNAASSFSNSLGDLKKNIEYLIGMERHSGSMEIITPLYISRMLHVPLEEVENVMKDMNL